MVLRRTLRYPLLLTFFGLTSNNASEFRLSIFNQIHEIVFHGQGGYSYDIVYDMPIWLRIYTFNKLKDWYNVYRTYFHKMKAYTVTQETNGIISDGHYSKIGHEVIGNLFYEHIITPCPII